MPRPKKPGAAEPKRRSRNGCWPCKTRKVKCDELRPDCANCRKQGETCDYSIRLNWEGRGKNKAGSDQPGQISFSTGITSPGGRVRPRTAGSDSTPTARQEEFLAISPKGQLRGEIPEFQAQQRSDMSFPGHHPPRQQETLQHMHARSTAYEMPTVDRDLIASPGSPAAMYTDGTHGGMKMRQKPQYTQSHELYRSTTPGEPTSGQSLEPLRLPHACGLDEQMSSTGPTSYKRSPNLLNDRGTTLSNGESFITTSSFHNHRRGISDPHLLETAGFDKPAKRVRLQAAEDINSPSYHETMPPPKIAATYHTYSVNCQTSTAMLFGSGSASTPATPASSHNDDTVKDAYRSQQSQISPHIAHASPDTRRMSVNSLLSGPPGILCRSERTYDDIDEEIQDWPNRPPNLHEDTTTYGIDRGFKDLDIGKNDDMNAISGASSLAVGDDLDLTIDEEKDLTLIEFGFGTADNPSFRNGAYYDKPVPVSIPRSLEPLPNKLLENPMNLLYFHHFLNHTAGCLIPHNCSSNPFKRILPQMAVQNDDLLSLLLAYSASHRARLLRQPEPATRIALWVQDIFPNLRHALGDPNESISDASLATAIMLASLEIICPKAFGVSVPWQTHLDTARQMIEARGGPQRLRNGFRDDKVFYFLWSWFAYLDVLGSLSGGRANPWILDYEAEEGDDYRIDCILGFTSRCVRILAKIAELSRICDSERIGPDNLIREEWQPSEDVVARAEKLEGDLIASRLHPARPCTHMQSTGEAAYQWDSLEMAATNEAFHWGGLVHLHRRILGKPSTHNDVQTAVREIHGALYKVRRGSSAEACLLFPMFSAGCSTEDQKQRADILERIKGVECLGMTQVHRARTLMERVWETGKPWETLVAGEFFG